MQLVRLKLNDKNGFRGLPYGFEINFKDEFNISRDFNPYVLTGVNGSGKSNLLELISAIFFHLKCMDIYRPDTFEYGDYNKDGYRSNIAIPNAYEIEYKIIPEKPVNKDDEKGLLVKVEKKNNETPIVFIKRNEEYINIDEESYTRKEVLPKNIIAYSSGENEIISLPFYKMRFIKYDEYIYNLFNEIGFTDDFAGMDYLDTDYTQAILLSLFLMEEESVLQPLIEDIKIEYITRFQMVIKNYVKSENEDSWSQISNFEAFMDDDEFDIRHYGEKQHWILESLLSKEKINNINKFKRKIIDKFIACSTTYYKNDNDIYLDYYINDEMKNAFKDNFQNSLNLFGAFKILLNLNLYDISSNMKKEFYNSSSLYAKQTLSVLPSDERVMRFKEVYIKKQGVNKNILFKALSDGEHQFSHTLGICLLYHNVNCLFLFDEPETHFNPSWRAKLLTKIRECLSGASENRDNIMRDMLITTHTPYLVSDSLPENVLIFRKNDKNNIDVTRPEINTFGASVDLITEVIFGKSDTISEYAHNQLKNILKQFRTDNDYEKARKKIKSIFGDSVEKMLALKYLKDERR